MAILQARFLWPWGLLDVDIEDVGELSETRDRYLLAAVDKASTFLFPSPLRSKEVLGVARKLLDLALIFVVPLLIQSNPGTEFTAEGVGHLCRWQNVNIAHVLVGHARAQGTVKGLGGWLHEVLVELWKA